MMIALWVAGLWNGLASYWEVNVSATHSISEQAVGWGGQRLHHTQHQ